MRRILLAFAGLGVLAALLTTGQEAEAFSTRSTFETITISNTNPTPVHSLMVLKASHRYRLVASGTVSDWCDRSSTPCTAPLVIDEGVDALYCYATWRCRTPELWRQLQVNGMGLDQLAKREGKIAYAPSHVYTIDVTGITGRLTLVASDATWSAGGNSGVFKLRVTDLGPATTTAGLGPLYLRVLHQGGLPFSLGLPTRFTYVATPSWTRYVHVTAWLAPGGNLPKGTYYQTHILFEMLENGRWQFVRTGVTNPSYSPVYYCPRNRDRPQGYSWVWRATLREGPDKILAVSNTVRTTCVFQP
jgi:hypothetical protein